MTNGIIPSVKNQILVLDRLAEFYFSGVDSFIELMSEMTGEISFKELRSTILYLIEFGYIKRSYTGKGNEFFVKITKKGITYYEKIFQPEDNICIKESFLDKIKKLSEGVDSLKGIATGAVAIFTIFGVSFHSEISDKFSANILNFEKSEIIFTEKEAVDFLKREFPKSLNVSCELKKPLEMVCDIKFNDFQNEDLRLFDSEDKKINFNKKIILKKDSSGKIFLIK